MKPLSALPVIGLQASFSSPAQHLSKGLISSRLVFFLESFMCLKAFQGWSIAVLTAYTAEHKQSLTFRIIDLRWKQNEMHNRKDYMRGIYLPRQIQALMLRSRRVITQFVVYRLSSFHHGSLCFCVWFPISSNFFPTKRVLPVNTRLFCSSSVVVIPNKLSGAHSHIWQIVTWHKYLLL